MGQINKEFDAMEFLEELYEIEKQIMGEYIRFHDGVKEGTSLENLDLLKLKLLIIKEKGLLNRITPENIKKLIHMAKEEEEQEKYSFDQDNESELDVESQIKKRIRARLSNVLMEVEHLLNGKSILYNKTIKISVWGISIALEEFQRFLLAEKEIFNLQKTYGLQDELIKELYIGLNLGLLRDVSTISALETLMILYRSNLNIDKELIESVDSIKRCLFEQNQNEMNIVSPGYAIFSIDQLAEIKLGLGVKKEEIIDDASCIESLYYYINLWAQLEIALKSCQLKYIDYLIKYVEEMEYFADERIRDSILELLKTKKNKLK